MGVVVGVIVGGLAVWAWMQQAIAAAETEARLEARLREMVKPQPGDSELMERVLERLLGAVVPEPPKEKAADEVMAESPAEYDPPDEPVGDWTDPFFGIDRPMVARLAPGQSVPGMPVDEGSGQVDAVEMWRREGEGAFEEWARDTMVPGEVASDGGWPVVEPVNFDE